MLDSLVNIILYTCMVIRLSEKYRLRAGPCRRQRLRNAEYNTRNERATNQYGVCINNEHSDHPLLWNALSALYVYLFVRCPQMA